MIEVIIRGGEASKAADTGDEKAKKGKSNRHRLQDGQPNAVVGAISTDPRPNAGTRFMIIRREGEASKGAGSGESEQAGARRVGFASLLEQRRDEIRFASRNPKARNSYKTELVGA